MCLSPPLPPLQAERRYQTTMERYTQNPALMRISPLPPLQAERRYQTAMGRYPQNPALMRSYARYQADIAGNPWRAMRLFM